jgi:hypothetical protein
MAEPQNSIISILDHTLDLVSRVQPRIAAATVPLYLGPVDEPSKPPYKLDFHANGVLVSYGNNPLILTANHVFDDIPKGYEAYYHKTSGEYYSIPGLYQPLAISEAPDLDMGLWVIDPEQRSDIPYYAYDFLDGSLNLDAPGGEFFILAGYPASAFRGRSAFKLITIIALRTNDHLNRYNRNRFIVLKYDRDNQKGSHGPRLGVSPVGMSGCGVYRCSLLPRKGEIVSDLVGIFTDYLKKEDILLVERIDYAMQNIRD